MAPETRGEARAASALSDQYSLGVTLQRCVRGLAEGAPPALEVIVRTALHEDPFRRFATLRELGEALLPFAREEARARWREEFVDDSEPATLLLHAPPTAIERNAAPSPNALRAPSVATPFTRETTVHAPLTTRPQRRVYLLLAATAALGSYLALTLPRAPHDLSRAARAPCAVARDVPDAGALAPSIGFHPQAPEVRVELPTLLQASDGGLPARVTRRATSARPVAPQRPTPTVAPVALNGAPILPP
jgi:hypothetical protein